MYTIYHIPGVKVGCSHDFEQRKSQQYDEGTVFEILDQIPDTLGPKFAGDVEWFYAAWFGYKKGHHYSTHRWVLEETWDDLFQHMKRHVPNPRNRF